MFKYKNTTQLQAQKFSYCPDWTQMELRVHPHMFGVYVGHLILTLTYLLTYSMVQSPSW